MNHDLIKLLDLYKKLLKIIEDEGDEQTSYARYILSNDIKDLEDLNINGIKDENLKKVFTKLRRRYESLYPIRGGLSEFFVWRKNFEERLRENKKLNNIKKEIEIIFNRNC